MNISTENNIHKHICNKQLLDARSNIALLKEQIEYYNYLMQSETNNYAHVFRTLYYLNINLKKEIEFLNQI